MKISKRITVDGPRFRLRLINAEMKREENFIFAAQHPGEGAAVIEAQNLVLAGTVTTVEVLDIEADDVLYTVQREEKDIVTYSRSS